MAVEVSILKYEQGYKAIIDVIKIPTKACPKISISMDAGKIIQSHLS